MQAPMTFRPIFVLALAALLSGWISVGHAAQKELHWAGCVISKLGFMQDLADAYEKKTGIKIVLGGGGATKGVREVAAKHTDLGGGCRLPLVYRNSDGSYNIEEREKKIKIIPLGWDALVVTVHPENPLIESITRDQLREVLTGKITHWKQLGADTDKAINLYDNVSKISGVGRTLRQQLFDDPEFEFTGRAIRLATAAKIEQTVGEDPYSLAVSGFSSSRHRAVKMIQLEGSEPTMETLSAGNYHLYRLLFWWCRKNISNRPRSPILSASPSHSRDSG